MDGSEAIAIVGVGCRYPGADNHQEFWELLKNGEDHVKEIPTHRWNNEAFYDADPDAKGKSYVTKAAFIEDIEGFDNKYFGIPAAEAQRMDPQQKLVLECSHMAFEDGGFTRKYLDGSKTGVYLGSMTNDQQSIYVDAFEDMINYSLTGMSTSILSNRVSYQYNLLGPSMTIDTACSSGLVATHQAIFALREGDIDLAVCGAVSVMQLPYSFIALSKARMLSQTGKCHTFSADADGYARGEGCGVVILKRLKEALRDNDRVWGVIVTGCNQDGRMATPITAPSQTQQVELLESIYGKFNINPLDIQYIEAHGTGTPTGDPIEFNSIGSFFTDAMQRSGTKCLIPVGSAKTNVGHGEPVAGITGLIKILLMMEHGEIVPSLHFSREKANPKLCLEKYCLEVTTNNRKWQKQHDGSRMSCVSAFGFGGTNSHAVVKQINFTEPHTNRPHMDVPYIVAFSAKTIDSLKNTLQHFCDNLQHERQSLECISYTSTCRRDHFVKRVAVCSSSKDDLIKDVERAQTNYKPDSIQLSKEKKICFVFCGVGTTWRGMCNDLINVVLFRDTIKKIDTILKCHTGWSILEKFSTSDPSVVDDPFVGHICIFACQVAIACLWKSFGITPTAIVGMSVGEVAAAYISGLLSLEDATKVIFERSKFAAQATGGAMCVVGNRSIGDVETACSHTDNRASIAVQLSPVSCTVSGDIDGIDVIKKLLKSGTNPETYFVKDLNAKCAYHSHYMEESSKLLFRSLTDLTAFQPITSLYSTVTGHKATQGDFSTPLYWKRNLRQMVKFQQALQNSDRETECNIFIEIGPRPTLKSHMENIFAESVTDKVCLPSMQKGQGYKTLHDTLCILYMAGLNPIWENVQSHTDTCLSQIPRYQFGKINMSFKPDEIALKLSGISSNDDDHIFTKRTVKENEMKVIVSRETTKFAYEHYVDGNVVVPGAFYAEIALSIGKIIFDDDLEDYEISVKFRRPLKLKDEKRIDIVANVQRHTSDRSLDFTVNHKNETLAEGKVQKETKKRTLFVKIRDMLNQMTESISMEEVYQILKWFGFEYGPTLKTITRAYTFGPEVVCEVTVEKSVLGELKRTCLHPAILDAMFQATAITFNKTHVRNQGSRGAIIVPSGIRRLVLKGKPREKMFLASKILKFSDGNMHADLLLTDLDGRVIVEMEDFHCRLFNDKFRIEDVISYNMAYKELLLDDQATCSPEHIHKYVLIVTSNTNQTVQKVTNILPSGSYDMIHLSSDEQMKEEYISRLLQGVKSLENTTLLLFPAGMVTDEEISGIDVFNKIKHSCLVFMNILKYLISTNIDIPIVIVTNNTMKVNKTMNETSNDFGSNSRDISQRFEHLTNVIGSELWGMTRGVVSEFSYKSILLVDVDNEEISIIRDVLCACSRRIQRHMSEIRIQNNSVYHLFIEHQRSALIDPIDFKQRLYDDSGEYPVEMKSTNSHYSQEPFFVIKQSDKLISKPGYVQIEVEVAYLNNGKTIPFSKTACMDGLDIWPNDHVNGHSILTLEVVGRKVEGSGCKSTKGSRENDRVVGLYPMVVCNKISIPESCTCCFDDIPSYRPGILQQSALFWSITSAVPSHCSVCIVYKKDHPHSLEEMLRERNVQKVESLSTQAFVECDIEQDTLLLLTTVPNLWIETIVRSKNLTTIISARAFLSKEQELLIHDTSSTVKTTVLDIHDIFSEKSLEKLAPELFQWFKCSKYVSKNENLLRPEIRNGRTNPSVVEFSKSSLNIEYAIKASDVFVRTYTLELFQKNATYVIVGGLTGLGWTIVCLLAERQAGHIVTFSRRKPSHDIICKMEELQTTHGCIIVSERCDVTDIESLNKAFRNISHITSEFPLKGIFQGAAVTEDGIIPNQTMETFDKVLKPKVLGTWNLHQMTRRLKLDYFVMHSSIASVFGNPGQSNYAAANAFMDTFAHYRHDVGLVGTAINWGALEVGIAVSSESMQHKLESRGYKLLRVEEITSCLLDCLISQKPQSICAAMEWSLLSRKFATSNLARYENMFGTQFDKTKKPHRLYQSDDEEAFDVSVLKNMASPDKRKVLFQIVENITRDTMMVDEELNVDQKLTELAIDSFQAMTIINRIHEMTRHKIPLFSLLDTDASIDTIVDNLIDYFDQTEKSKTDVETVNRTDDSKVVDEISEGEKIPRNKEKQTMNTSNKEIVSMQHIEDTNLLTVRNSHTEMQRPSHALSDRNNDQQHISSIQVSHIDPEHQMKPPVLDQGKIMDLEKNTQSSTAHSSRFTDSSIDKRTNSSTADLTNQRAASHHVNFRSSKSISSSEMDLQYRHTASTYVGKRSESIAQLPSDGIGRFEKLMSSGLTHNVQITIEERGTPYSHQFLCWSSGKFSRSTKLDVTKIDSVLTERQNGTFLMRITTQKRQFVFYNKDSALVQKWANELQQRLDRNKRSSVANDELSECSRL